MYVLCLSICSYSHTLGHTSDRVWVWRQKTNSVFHPLWYYLVFFHCRICQPSCLKSFWEFCFVLPWDFWDYSYGLSRLRESRLKSWHLQKYLTCWAILPAPDIHFKCNFESLQILIFSKTSSVVMLVCVHVCLNKLYFLIIYLICYQNWK